MNMIIIYDDDDEFRISKPHTHIHTHIYYARGAIVNCAVEQQAQLGIDFSKKKKKRSSKKKTEETADTTQKDELELIEKEAVCCAIVIVRFETLHDTIH